MDSEFIQTGDWFPGFVSRCNLSCRGELARSNGIPSTILGMMSLQKEGTVNLVLGGSTEITGKPSGDQNTEIMTFGVDIIVRGRDCGVTLSGSYIRP
jgi:hypothetical protein